MLNGGDVFSLQRILGHTTLDMVKRYIALCMSFASRDEPRIGVRPRHVELLVVADHNILWLDEALAGEQGFEP